MSIDEVYGKREDFETVSIDEQYVLEPMNPYTATKYGGEFLAKSYHLLNYNLWISY